MYGSRVTITRVNAIVWSVWDHYYTSYMYLLYTLVRCFGPEYCTFRFILLCWLYTNYNPSIAHWMLGLELPPLIHGMPTRFILPHRVPTFAHQLGTECPLSQDCPLIMMTLGQMNAHKFQPFAHWMSTSYRAQPTECPHVIPNTTEWTILVIFSLARSPYVILLHNYYDYTWFNAISTIPW